MALTTAFTDTKGVEKDEDATSFVTDEQYVSSLSSPQGEPTCPANTNTNQLLRDFRSQHGLHELLSSENDLHFTAFFIFNGLK